ncbi:MAG: hypothetical protein EOS03_13465 [Mesorhizobium sp.]|uniref:hypothetical protein n=1 Tax=Mesorhizobium sp. TaxID=1871066 RepID=UPI000FE704F2|nr:hypothetical protein [Mesorhizobium sp.]RWN47352.1 MAG: hypothetical protein EOS03_13465 [Mesorhizobium sp.]
MSRGHGRIQTAILALIASDDDGAWTTTDICAEVFRGANRVEKKHRVAVSRGLRTMRLPESWSARIGDRQGCEYVLYNRLSLESATRMRWLALFGRSHCSYDKFRQHYSHQVDKARDHVDEYRRYFEADEIGRITIRIATEQKRAGLAEMIGARPEFFLSIAEEIKALTERKAALEAARVSVSASPNLQNGNTYEGKAV